MADGLVALRTKPHVAAVWVDAVVHEPADAENTNGDFARVPVVTEGTLDTAKPPEAVVHKPFLLFLFVHLSAS